MTDDLASIVLKDIAETRTRLSSLARELYQTEYSDLLAESDYQPTSEEVDICVLEMAKETYANCNFLLRELEKLSGKMKDAEEDRQYAFAGLRAVFEFKQYVDRLTQELTDGDLSGFLMDYEAFMKKTSKVAKKVRQYASQENETQVLKARRRYVAEIEKYEDFRLAAFYCELFFGSKDSKTTLSLVPEEEFTGYTMPFYAAKALNEILNLRSIPEDYGRRAAESFHQIIKRD